MSAVFGLFRLQQIDSQITLIETRLAEIQKTLDDNAELQAALKQVEDAEKEENDSERAQHRSEAEAQGQKIKIQQAEASLYGGTVRNPKELQDLQADIVSLKKHLNSLEERELQDMLQTETAQVALNKAKSDLSGVRSRLDREHGTLFEEKETLTLDRGRFQSERQAATSAIAGEILKTYEDLRQRRRGVAVAEVLDNACSACGTTLTAAIQQAARHAERPIHCPACGRILYAS